MADGRQQKRVTGDKISLLLEHEKRFKAFVPHDKKGWIATIQQIPGRAWNAEQAYWSLPYVKMSFRLIKKFIGMANVQIGFTINPAIPEELPAAKRVSSHTIKNKAYHQLNASQREAVILLEEKLTLEKRAYSTIKTYKNHLIGLFIFYKERCKNKFTF